MTVGWFVIGTTLALPGVSFGSASAIVPLRQTRRSRISAWYRLRGLIRFFGTRETPRGEQWRASVATSDVVFNRRCRFWTKNERWARATVGNFLKSAGGGGCAACTLPRLWARRAGGLRGLCQP